MVKPITTTNAAAAIGPYSQAVRAGDFVYVSGQIPLDPETGQIVSGGVKEQTERVLQSLQAILEAAGASFNEAVKFTIYLKDMEDFGVVNEVYGSYLAEPYPARATVEVSRLPKDVLVEIDVIAYIE